ncbi:tropomyosin-like [Palaemon carinicauda]|uniref:tropomyosin-like n=1 Tax=Palaemon carinicauda TaxID=392227 RepID=UPI0035B6A537
MTIDDQEGNWKNRGGLESVENPRKTETRMESSAMERNRVSLIKQKSENPRPGIVNDLVEKFEKMQKIAEKERSSTLENKGKVRKLVLQYEEKIKGDAIQTRNSKLDCLGIRRNPMREAKEVALARIVRIQEFERSKNEREIISRTKRQNDKSHEGTVNDMDRKLEKTRKMAEQERSPSLDNKGKVRKLVLQYEEKIKGDAKQTRNSKLDCLGIRRNPIREAKEVALARIVRIQEFERSKNEREIISRTKRQNDKSHEGTVNDMDRKLEKTRKMAEQERSPSLDNKGKVRKLVLQYEEKIKGDAKQTRNNKLDCLGIKRNAKREAKQVALATIVGIQKNKSFTRKQRKVKVSCYEI